MLELIKSLLMENDELTARQLRDRLTEKHPSLNVSLTTIKRARKKGWVCTRPHYCQLLQKTNKIKHAEWCQRQLNSKEQFKNVIFLWMNVVWNLSNTARFVFVKSDNPALKAKGKTSCTRVASVYKRRVGCDYKERILP